MSAKTRKMLSWQQKLVGSTISRALVLDRDIWGRSLLRLPRLEKNVNVYTEDTNRNVHEYTSIKYLRKVSANLPHNIPDMNTLA